MEDKKKIEKKKIRIHNKSDKPDNIVEAESNIADECEKLEAALPSYLAGYFMYIKNNLLPLSRLAYLRELTFFCNYLIEQTDLAEGTTDIKKIKQDVFEKVTSTDVNIFFDYCRRYKVETEKNIFVYENNNYTLSRKKSVLTVFFKYLYRDGFVSKNITDGFDPIRVSRASEREIKAMQDDEVMIMLDAVVTGEGLTDKEKIYWEKTRKRDKLILLLFVTYGLRLSELQQLNLSSFNFGRGEFLIYRKRAKESAMPINRTIEEAYHEYVLLERPEEDRIEESHRDALFLSIQGKRLTQRQIREIVKKYTSIGLKTSRSEGYSPHKLRATAATSLIARGNSIYDVQELLDHENVTTTQLYAAHRKNAKRDLIRNFEWGEDMKAGSGAGAEVEKTAAPDDAGEEKAGI